MVQDHLDLFCAEYPTFPTRTAGIFSKVVNGGKLLLSEHAEALALSDARLFDPMGGRPMKEWIEVPVEHASLWLGFARAALRYVDKG